MENERGLVFVHIPKTAGSTLRTIIDRQYPRGAIFRSDGPHDVARLTALPEKARRRLRGEGQSGGHARWRGRLNHLYRKVRWGVPRRVGRLNGAGAR